MRLAGGADALPSEGTCPPGDGRRGVVDNSDVVRRAAHASPRRNLSSVAKTTRLKTLATAKGTVQPKRRHMFEKELGQWHGATCAPARRLSCDREGGRRPKWSLGAGEIDGPESSRSLVPARGRYDRDASDAQRRDGAAGGGDRITTRTRCGYRAIAGSLAGHSVLSQGARSRSEVGSTDKVGWDICNTSYTGRYIKTAIATVYELHTLDKRDRAYSG